MAGKLVSLNLSELAYARIKKMIAEYRFLPGSRINVEELTRKLGASRTPIWEAIRRLEQEGLVRNVPNRGVFLVELTREDAAELYAVREVLEGMAARLAVSSISDRALDRMDAFILEQEKLVSEENLVGYSRSDYDFHAGVYAACGNNLLKEMLESIKNRARPLAMRITPILPELLEDHREIVRAFRCRDPELAEAAFRKHNRKVLALLLSASEASEAPESNTH